MSCDNNNVNISEKDARIDWRTLSKQENDSAYSPSQWSRVLKPQDAVANFIQVINNKSDAARAAIKNCEFDVPYGESEREKVEILKPDNPAEDAPVVVFFHGGVWQLLSKEEHSLAAPPLVKHGAIMVSVGYSLAPQASLSTIVGQCEKAVAFVAKRFPKSSAFYTSGHSAGGHLAAMMVSVDWTKYQLPANLIKGSCPFCGIFDVRPFVNTYMNDALKLTLDEAWELSPINLIQKACKYSPDTKMYVVYGDHDSPAYRQMSTDYSKMLIKAGMSCQSKQVTDADHFEVMQNLSDENNEGTQMLLEMMSLKTN
ncbi:kynurenine formamidase-like [Amphiura filiformis]|uniref:kynurenine formamidase-like n=1 Tax=Amphiura filiformis TaxID=82378 RepID=UPI003B2213D7